MGLVAKLQCIQRSLSFFAISFSFLLSLKLFGVGLFSKLFFGIILQNRLNQTTEEQKMALPRVYFDVTANGQDVGQVIMEVGHLIPSSKHDLLDHSRTHPVCTGLNKTCLFKIFYFGKCIIPLYGKLLFIMHQTTCLQQ